MRNPRFLFSLQNYLFESDFLTATPPKFEVVDLIDPSEIDRELAKRVIEAYWVSRDQDYLPSGLWVQFSKFHRELKQALDNKDDLTTARILINMFAHPCTTGLCIGEESYKTTLANSIYDELIWHDKAISLVQAWGGLRTINPETQELHSLQCFDSRDALIKRLRATDFKFDFPKLGGLTGVNCDGTVLPINSLFHLYAAKRIQAIAGSSASILEIGGGVGGLALAMAQNGSAKFAIVDLPIVNAIQSFFLLKSNVGSRVVLAGEPRHENSIHIIPAPLWRETDIGSFDLIFNQDSFPEMGDSVVQSYLSAIADMGIKYMLSINQETCSPDGVGNHSWVFQLANQLSEYELFYRCPYWLRRGYTEELYRVG